MDDGLKQRIVGAIVLVAIGVVFVPVIFDRERIEPLDRQSQVPPAPSIEPVRIEAASPPREQEPVPSGEDIYVPEQGNERESSVNLKEKSPVLDEQGTPNSWVLQIASYRFAGHAKERRDRLIKEGYTAFTREVKTERGTMTRLYVGPNLDKGKIIAAKKAIDEMLGVNTVVLRFKP